MLSDCRGEVKPRSRINHCYFSSVSFLSDERRLNPHDSEKSVAHGQGGQVLGVHYKRFRRGLIPRFHEHEALYCLSFPSSVCWCFISVSYTTYESVSFACPLHVSFLSDERRLTPHDSEQSVAHGQGWQVLVVHHKRFRGVLIPRNVTNMKH